MLKNNIKNILIISFIIILTSFSIFGIFKSINYINQKNNEVIIANKNEITVSNDDIFYVDLTNKPDDYIKIEERINSIEEEKKNNIEGNKTNSTPSDEKLNKINEEFFDIEFDLNSKLAVVDGEKYNLEEIIDIPENVQPIDYIRENIVGDIELNENNIRIENPYSTNSIIIETHEINNIEDIGNVDSIVKVAQNTYCVNYKSAKDTKEGYNILKTSEKIKNICKDAKVTIIEGESENTKIKAQYVSENNYVWGAKTTGLYKYLSELNDTNLPTIRIGILDTGVRTTHEVFLNEKKESKIELTNAYNYVERNSNIVDDNGHGTMVAGIIAESTSNNVKIVPIKVLNAKGEGELSDTLQAIATVSEKVDILNVSLGIPKDKLSEEALNICETILKQVNEKNKVIVCATGNEGIERVYYPAISNYTLAVTATNFNNEIAFFSNYGDSVDFAAPGVGLVLPYYTGDDKYNSSFPEGSIEYNRNSGTSFAAPFITSAVALIKSENSNYNIDQVKNVLKNNSEDLGAIGKDKYYGYGLLNFYKEMFKPKQDEDTTNENTTENTITEEPKDEKMLGDVNKSNTIDIGDITMLLRHIAQDANKEVFKQNPNWKLSESLIKIGDVNKNNIIDIGDIVKLLRYIAANNNQVLRQEHPEWIDL